MCDAFAMAMGVIRESARLAGERSATWWGAGAGIPQGLDAITPSWMSAALADTFPGTQVERVRILGRTDGTTSRARLALDLGAGSPRNAPASVFVKLVPAPLAIRLFVNLMGLGATEARFYRDLAPSLGPVERPRALHASIEGAAGRFALVLEDLAARGAQPIDLTYAFTADRAQQVMETLGRLHAAFWESPRFACDLAWLESPAAGSLYRRGRFVSSYAIRRVLGHHAGLVPPALHPVARRVAAERDRLEAAWAKGPNTLLHGDAHAGNMYLLPDAVGLLDWQCARRGHGMRDVAYFLATSLPTALRRARQEELIGQYLHTLSGAGVTAPTFSEAWAAYRLHVIYAWIAALVTVAAGGLQSSAIARAGLERTSTALLDLDATTALDAI